MTKLPTPKSEGDKMTCPDCKMPIVARLKTYKDNQYPAYVQWQNPNETKAHKTKDGNCKNQEVTPEDEIMLNPKEETTTASTSQEFSTGGTVTGDFPFYNLTDHEMIARTYDMISQMFCDWCDKKLKEPKQ